MHIYRGSGAANTVSKAVLAVKPAVKAKAVTFSKEAIAADAVEFKPDLSFSWQSQNAKRILAKTHDWEVAHPNKIEASFQGDAPLVEASMQIAKHAEPQILHKLQYLTRPELPICNTPVQGVAHLDVNAFLLKHQDAFIKLAGYVCDSPWDLPY